MSGLSDEVAALRLRVELAIPDYSQGRDLLDAHAQVVTGGQSEVEIIQESLGYVIAKAETLAGAIAEGAETGASAARKATKNAALASGLTGDALILFNESANGHAASALEHLQYADEEMGKSALATIQTVEETKEAIGLAQEIHKTLGSAATMLASLHEKLETIHRQTYPTAGGHASTAIVRNQDAIAELGNYYGDLEH